MKDLPNSLPILISAIGGLGTAAFGLLEALKPVCPFINRIGLGGIQRTVTALTPFGPAPGGAGSQSAARPQPAAGQAPINTLPRQRILQTLESNWVNGNDLDSQKAIAKSLIKLHLSACNAANVAKAANVDPAQLNAVARYMDSAATPVLPPSQASPVALTQQQSDTWSRFDLIVTAMLDDCYQCADQLYRNWTRGLAAAIAVALALTGGYVIAGDSTNFFNWRGIGEAFLVGLLATPLAPVAKDLSTALATAVNAMQLVKKP